MNRRRVVRGTVAENDRALGPRQDGEDSVPRRDSGHLQHIQLIEREHLGRHRAGRGPGSRDGGAVAGEGEQGGCDHGRRPERRTDYSP